MLTALYYPNTGHEAANGGELSVLPLMPATSGGGGGGKDSEGGGDADGGSSAGFSPSPSSSSSSWVNIAPIQDRLVMLLSESVWHQVRPVYFPRFALTVWMGTGASPGNSDNSGMRTKIQAKVPSRSGSTAQQELPAFATTQRWDLRSADAASGCLEFEAPS